MVQYSTDRNAYLNNNDTIFEVMLNGGGITAYLPKGNLNTGADAFGRMRVSNPHTLFDSFFRYNDNRSRWAQKLSGAGTSTFNATQGVVDLAVNQASGDQVIRETNRVFGYQPGKGLLIMNTFTMAAPKIGLRQRVGYFGKFNGIYFEQNDLSYAFVKRSSISGSIVNTPVNQQDWNVDKLDGSGPSGVTADFTKSQIFWTDIEWLGVGSVRCGFVINGQFIICHIMHHANSITGAYITTASLPCRYEITNTSATTSSSTMKQICCTVVSEGGYTLHNITRSVSNDITGKNVAAADTPMVSVRLRKNRTDAIVVPVSVDFYGIQATGYKYKLLRKVTSLTGASWATLDSASSVEYDVSATALTGGEIIKEGIFRGQDTVPPLLLSEIFNSSIALTREIIDSDSSGNVFTIAITPTTNNDDAVVSLTWQEHI